MRKKLTKAQNKFNNQLLISRYPFLLPRNDWTGEVSEDYDYEYTLLDEIPEGWRNAFGMILMEELRKACLKTHYLQKLRIMQIKEKFGQLRIYFSDAPRECQDIVNKYEIISEYVCIRCGKLDVPMMNDSWISPYCKTCWTDMLKRQVKASRKYSSKPVDEKAYLTENAWENRAMNLDDCTIPDSYQYMRYNRQADTETTVTVDISETVRKIREWAKKKTDA